MNRLSARNQIKGKIVDVAKGATTSPMRIEIGGGTVNHGLDHQRGGSRSRPQSRPRAWAVIKASDVMVGV